MTIVTLFLVICLWLGARGAWAEFRAGVARRVITPDPLLPVTSGAGPCRPARDKHMDLEVRALVFDRNQTRVAIASMPLLGFPAPWCARVAARVEGVPAENLLIGSTHCHSAPDCYGFPNEDGEYDIDLDWVDWVCTQTADAVNEAVILAEPAAVRAATGEARGRIAYNYYASDLYDPRCHVLQVVRQTGAPLATLVNYAIHPEILLRQNVCSPDLVGPLYARIEEAGGGVGVFMNGAQGGMVTADIRTPDGDKEEWSECERIGRTLADEAMRIVADAPAQEDPVLWCEARELTFPVKETMAMLFMMLHPDARPWIEPPTSVTTRQNLVNVGDAQILTIPGEALPNIGFFLKRHMRGRHNLLFGLTNDAFGYFLAHADYDSFKVYEYITQTCLHELAGEILMNESLALIGNTPTPDVRI